jgi:hypothetical protein
MKPKQRTLKREPWAVKIGGDFHVLEEAYFTILHLMFFLIATNFGMYNAVLEAFKCATTIGKYVPNKALISTQLSDFLTGDNDNKKVKYKFQKIHENLRSFIHDAVCGIGRKGPTKWVTPDIIEDLKEAITAFSSDAQQSFRVQQLAAKENDRELFIPQTVLEVLLFCLKLYAGEDGVSYFKETTGHMEAFVIAELEFTLLPLLSPDSAVSETFLIVSTC